MEELVKQQQEFKPYLREKDYTFIGPVDQNLFESFLKNANYFAPIAAFSRTIHHSLSHEDSILKSIALLPAGTQLRLYTVINESEQVLYHATIEDYCKRFNINYPE